ncbi:hypothetical protein V8G54_026647, partial [Vigna mungo]
LTISISNFISRSFSLSFLSSVPSHSHSFLSRSRHSSGIEEFSLTILIVPHRCFRRSSQSSDAFAPTSPEKPYTAPPHSEESPKRAGESHCFVFHCRSSPGKSRA